jgi:hypothetical protein
MNAHISSIDFGYWTNTQMGVEYRSFYPLQQAAASVDQKKGMDLIWAGGIAMSTTCGYS